MSEKHKHPEYLILADLLGRASDEFSNHGCNDYELPNTPENRALVESMERWNLNGDDPDELNISRDGKTIYTQDYFLMSYFAHLCKSAEVGLLK